MERFVPEISKLLSIGFCLAAFAIGAVGQSSDQRFPTAVTTNEIIGQVKARDIGDSRLTTYFYAFDGGQGDIFINVVTKNFNGDIDIFTADNLRPLTKMVIYADTGPNETGRLIYLRKSEHLLLRIEGRSPNDDAATYRIKFAGSFVALGGANVDDAPTIAKSGSDDRAGARVNSVGTIVEVKPRPTPQAERKTEAAVREPVITEKPKVKIPDSVPVKRDSDSAKSKNDTSVKPDKKAEPAPTSVVADENKAAKTETEPAPKPAAKTTASKMKNTPAAEKPTKQVPKQLQEDPDVKPPNPLENIKLVIQMKDGRTFESPMSEVRKFSVDNGMLTVIKKDGDILRYSILEVAKFTMQ